MIRLGKIGFANCDFPYFGLEHSRIEARDISITEAHPVDLAWKIFKNELDISPISSIMYPKLGNLLILPGLSITSSDFTKSVLICANGKMELSDFGDKTLCIPDTTASSAALIQIILKLKGLKTKIKHCRGDDISRMLRMGDGALLIGDSALYAVGKYRIIADLGNEWKKITGKKMVYALWVVREEFAREHPEDVGYVLKRLIESKDYAYQHIDEIADFIGVRKNLDKNFLMEYIHTLNYDFDSESIESLRLYFKYARECGILEREMPLRFFEAKNIR